MQFFGDYDTPLISVGPVPKAWQVICYAYNNWDTQDFDLCNEEHCFDIFLTPNDPKDAMFENIKELRQRVKSKFKTPGNYVLLKRMILYSE